MDRIDSIVGKGTHVNGTVVSSGSLRVDGKVEGEIKHEGDLLVGEGGVVAANIKANNVTIAGEVIGNIEAGGKLEITSKGRVVGDISAKSLVLSEGAVFKGTSRMVEDSPGVPAQRKKENG
ncbi:MAG: polymer-forming cytoskeletal protein [Bacillota bacterium]